MICMISITLSMKLKQNYEESFLPMDHKWIYQTDGKVQEKAVKRKNHRICPTAIFYPCAIHLLSVQLSFDDPIPPAKLLYYIINLFPETSSFVLIVPLTRIL